MRVCVCVCVCVCARARARARVCVCVCERLTVRRSCARPDPQPISLPVVGEHPRVDLFPAVV